MTLTPGQTLQQRYRVDSLLGRGGMGAVYRAWDMRLNLSVALKEMVPQPGLNPHDLAQLRTQFRQEASILARLHHPNLVRVTDFFEEGGNAYLVMGYVEGESLAHRIAREGALSEAQVLSWADQLLDAVAYCHANGVIHRDVKPQNVIIDPSGHAVLVDFGLVKLWDPADPRTRTAMRGMGTPEYAPPEQYDTPTTHTDARSDIYGLGATLYHALAGKVPPTATQRVVDPSSLRAVRTLNANVSRPVEAIVMRAIALRPDARFASAESMREALHAIRPTTPRERAAVAPGAAKAARSRVITPRTFGGFGIALLVVGVMLVALVVYGAIRFFGQRASDAEVAVESPAPTAPMGLTSTVVRSPSATRIVGTRTATRPPVTSTSRPTASPPPSDTPAPSDTPVVAPSPTRTPSPVPSPSPTLTPPCPAVTGPFAELWIELQGRLGCAVNEAHGTSMAEQTFEGGRMFWRQDRDSVLVLYGSGTWAGYPDTWTDGDPVYSCPATAPEESPPTPWRGFGKVWCSFSEVRDALGWATDGERGYNATVQDFQTGAILRNDLGAIYALYSDATWEQR